MTASSAPPTLLQAPLTKEQLEQLDQITTNASVQQLAWLSGYLWAKAEAPSSLSLATASSSLSATAGATEKTLAVEPAKTVTVLSASQTGNARRVAEQLVERLTQANIPAQWVQAADCSPKQLSKESTLLLVISTQGEGEPPEEALPLYKALSSKKAPNLNGVQFAVFALGDSSYEFFCQAGKVFDERFAALGGQRLLPRVDADVEYQPQAEQWINEVLLELAQQTPVLSEVSSSLSSSSAVTPENTAARYDKNHPFMAELLVKQRLTGRDSDKEIYHYELDLTDSGLQYQPGDALGILPTNDPSQVEELLSYVALKGEENVEVKGQTLSLIDALTHHFDIQLNTQASVKKYLELTESEKLNAELKAEVASYASVQQYGAQTPFIDMLRRYPCRLTAGQLLSLLRPLSPRLYSIASSQEEVGEEVHLTIATVRYQIDDKNRQGITSGFLADRLPIEATLPVFIESNPQFRLPKDSDTPIIMIGAGTGVAPFRAFMQERQAQDAKGKNWLFFGNPRFTQDFLYQIEWKKYRDNGLLTRIDLAWSRDQKEKVYVQDKLRQQASEIWQWLNQGAHLYVCGDANRMAKDVEQALLDIVSAQAHLDAEEAQEYLDQLRIEKRYQRDVY